jgi:hypothetical protein
VEIAEDRASSRKTEQRKAKEERTEINRPEGTDIPVFRSSFRKQKNKRNDNSRDILKLEGNQEAKHERRIDTDKRDIEMKK